MSVAEQIHRLLHAPADEGIAPPDSVPPAPLAKRKPVQLQMHRVGGVYFTVASFDAACEISEHYVRNAVEMLSAVDPTLKWRVIAPTLGSSNVLLSYEPATGWHNG